MSREFQNHLSDQGHGIPRQFPPQLFQRFSQRSVGDRRQTGGTGLGTAIVKRKSLLPMAGELTLATGRRSIRGTTGTRFDVF
ncbi:MAG: hypothetical protein IPM37_12460 [Hahellaceae bacterium]|nr:hypothetical protein [Hahellaceae bacterium]